MSDHDEPMSWIIRKNKAVVPCFSDAELACRLALQGRKQLFLGANAAVTRCLRRVFLRSSSIKLGFSDVSDSISLSQAVQSDMRKEKSNTRQASCYRETIENQRQSEVQVTFFVQIRTEF